MCRTYVIEPHSNVSNVNRYDPEFFFLSPTKQIEVKIKLEHLD